MPISSGKVTIVGAGRVGRAIAHVLSSEPGYTTVVCDANPEVAMEVAGDQYMVEAYSKDVSIKANLLEALKDSKAVISAVPPQATLQVAEAAAEAGVHFLDVIDHEVHGIDIKPIVEKASGDATFIPGCGLAPGYVSIAAGHMVDQFDTLTNLTIRAGSIPDQPNNRLKMNIAWDTDTLIRTYITECAVVEKHKLQKVRPLERRETILIGGVDYETFSVAGGISSNFLETYKDRVKHIQFKALRYPGHLDLIRFLLEDLRFRRHPEELMQILERSIPATKDTLAIVSIRALGHINGEYVERTFWRRIMSQYVGNAFLSGQELCAAACVCCVLDRLLQGNISKKGLVNIEDIPYDSFNTSIFAKYFEGRFSTV